VCVWGVGNRFGVRGMLKGCAQHPVPCTLYLRGARAAQVQRSSPLSPPTLPPLSISPEISPEISPLCPLDIMCVLLHARRARVRVRACCTSPIRTMGMYDDHGHWHA